MMRTVDKEIWGLLDDGWGHSLGPKMVDQAMTACRVMR